jgi:outer membrane protein TolC
VHICVLYILIALAGIEASSQETQTRVDPFAGEDRLRRDELVRAVLERNPSLEAARRGWEAAEQREPQVASLQDPMLSYGFAPLSIGSDDVRYGQRIELIQRFPYPGRLDLAGQIARAEADAARYDYEAVRLRLATMASSLFDDYYFVERSIEINTAHSELLHELQRVATVRYSSGLASQQDPIQAEVEAAHVLHEDMVLRTTRNVVIAQINALLHRLPTEALPAPPTALDPPDMASHSMEPAENALAERPELLARLAEIRAGEAGIQLREADFKPEFEAMTSYDWMWDDAEHRWMVGLGVSLPFRRGRAHAAVAEAEASLRRSQSERLALEDAIRLEVYETEQRVYEAAHVVELYRSRLLPASNDQVRAARAGFETGQNSFLPLIEAQRNQRNVELGYEESLSRYYQRLAERDRALGKIPGLPPEEQVSSRSVVPSATTPRSLQAFCFSLEAVCLWQAAPGRMRAASPTQKAQRAHGCLLLRWRGCAEWSRLSTLRQERSSTTPAPCIHRSGNRSPANAPSARWISCR